jgi:tetratricopeptide (TPR) repeat protein
VKTGRLDDAISAYEAVLKMDPQNGYAFFGLADIYRTKEMDVKAFDYLLKGFEDSEVNIQQKLMVMQSYMPQLKNSELLKQQAFQLAKTLHKVHPSEATPSVVLSDIYYEFGKKDSSVFYLESALKKQPSDFRVWQRLFSLLEDDKDYKTLVVKATEALDLFPNQVLVYSILSSSQYYLEEYQKAIDAASIGLDFSVNMQSKSNLLTIMAESFSGLDRLPEAFETYDRILAIDNNNALVLNNYAYLLSVKNQQLEKAETMVKRALELDPGNSSYVDTYGWVLFQLGKLEEAKTQLEKAYTSYGDSPEVINHYAEVLYKLGDKLKAAELWQKSLKIDANQPAIKSKLNEIGS